MVELEVPVAFIQEAKTSLLENDGDDDHVMLMWSILMLVQFVELAHFKVIAFLLALVPFTSVYVTLLTATAFVCIIKFKN